MASFIQGGFPSDWAVGPRRAAIELLLQAEGCARDTRCDIWDFAVEFPTLRAAGLTETDLRWMLKKEFLLHRLETTPVNESTRCFLGNAGLKFTLDSCFVLTGPGESLLRSMLHPDVASLPRADGRGLHDGRHVANGTLNRAAAPLNGHGKVSRGAPEMEEEDERIFVPLTKLSPSAMDDLANPGPVSGNGNGNGYSATAATIVRPLSFGETLAKTSHEGDLQRIAPAARPRWDDDRKELWFGSVLVKKFRFRSPNQEMVLIAFEEEHWPAKLDDPLPPVPNQTSKQRLHDAIKNLNRHHLHRVLRFTGDGTGEGVRWERVG